MKRTVIAHWVVGTLGTVLTPSSTAGTDSSGHRDRGVALAQPGNTITLCCSEGSMIRGGRETASDQKQGEASICHPTCRPTP